MESEALNLSVFVIHLVIASNGRTKSLLNRSRRPLQDWTQMFALMLAHSYAS